MNLAIDEFLRVSNQEFAELLEWSILSECEFLSRVWKKWPRLSKLPVGCPVRVVVEGTGELEK